MPTLRKLRPMRASVRLLIALSLLAAFASAIPARAADLVACGDTVITNVTLTEDLTCPGYGLVVGAHGITLDLGGHSITRTGPGSYANGVHNSSYDNVTIRNGSIGGFVNGVALFNGADDNTISDIELTGNEFGGINLLNNSDRNTIRRVIAQANAGAGLWIQQQSDHNVVTESRFSDHPFTGIILLEVRENVIDENVVTGNTERGISLWLSVHNEITGNEVSTSLRGIFLHGSSDGNEITGNELTSNPESGVEVRAGDDSLIAENVIVGSRRGVLLWNSSTGNTVTGNDISRSSGPPGNGAAVRVIDNSQSNWITENTVVDNEYGIDVGGADDNHILGNDVSDSAVDGFFVTGNLNTVEQNTVVDSGRHGYNVSGRFNSFTGNTSSSNGGYGFWDETAGGAGDAGTDNTYSGNVCFSNVLGQSFPDGLCAEPINSPPHADAGLDRLIEWSGGNIAVTLDGSGSSDPDGDTLSYAWSGGFGEGFATGVNPTVTFNELGDFEVTLTVDDGRGGTDTDSVIITLAAYCEGRPATITGTLGDDLLVGTPAADVIVALDGNDVVHAEGGNDVVCGGPGADRLRGQGGHDTVVGNDGFDLLWGGGGRDRLFGSEGNDVLRGHGGKDRLYGEGGDDSLYGGGNADHLHGGSGTDYVHGGGATDVCSGESVVACE